MSPMIRQPFTTELALLGFLRQRPMYGYEIHQQLSQANGLGLVWRMKQSQLYALLTKLEQAGLVRATIASQAPRPPRKVFHLTDEGLATFQRWVRSPVARGRELRLDFLVKLFFAEQEGQAVVVALLDGQRAVCQGWLAEEQSQVVAMAGKAPYEGLVHQFRAGQIEAMLAWLDSCESTLLTQPFPS